MTSENYANVNPPWRSAPDAPVPRPRISPARQIERAGQCRLAVEGCALNLAERRADFTRRECVVHELALAGQYLGAAIKERARGHPDAIAGSHHLGLLGNALLFLLLCTGRWGRKCRHGDDHGASAGRPKLQSHVDLTFGSDGQFTRVRPPTTTRTQVMV